MKIRHVLTLAAALAVASTAAFAQIGDDSPDSDIRVRRALESAELMFRVDSDGDFRLVFAEDDDRTQVVFINSQTSFYGSMEVREVWSCGYRPEEGSAISRARLEYLLQKNAGYKIGSWSLTSKGNVVFTVVVSANASADALDDAARAVANAADALEREWDGGDDL